MTKTAAIIGGGVIGGGWAARFALNGWNARVFDPDRQAARKIGEVMANARRSLPGLTDVALPAEGAITFHDSIHEAVEGAAWIQESVPERLDIKHKTFGAIQQACDPAAVIGSSTSGFRSWSPIRLTRCTCCRWWNWCRATGSTGRWWTGRKRS